MPDASSRAGAAAALLWVLLCLRWFDVAEPWRPHALAAVPPVLLMVAFAGSAVAWLRGRWSTLRGAPLGPQLGALGLVLVLAFFFRLPVVAGGAGAAVTADGALSGIVALHLVDGSERLVFVPQVPYSGSLKSHLAALLSFVPGLDLAQAFALASLLSTSLTPASRARATTSSRSASNCGMSMWQWASTHRRGPAVTGTRSGGSRGPSGSRTARA